VALPPSIANTCIGTPAAARECRSSITARGIGESRKTPLTSLPQRFRSGECPFDGTRLEETGEVTASLYFGEPLTVTLRSFTCLAGDHVVYVETVPAAPGLEGGGELQ